MCLVNHNRTQLMIPYNVCLLDAKNCKTQTPRFWSRFSTSHVKKINFQGLDFEPPESLSTQSTFAITLHINGPPIHLKTLKFYLQRPFIAMPNKNTNSLFVGVGKGHLFRVMPVEITAAEITTVGKNIAPCAHVRVYTHACGSQMLTLFFETVSLSINQELSDWLEWISNEPQILLSKLQCYCFVVLQVCTTTPSCGHFLQRR